jgi:DNA primase
VRPIDRVLEQLRNVRAHNGYFKARCPAHDDREPSLSISEGEDGRVLLNCFAGCDVGTIIARLGLQMSDLFDDDDGGGGKITP